VWPVVIISSRVHPGDNDDDDDNIITATIMISRRGIRLFLTEATPEAETLRETFEFRIFPMLIPYYHCYYYHHHYHYHEHHPRGIRLIIITSIIVIIIIIVTLT